MRVTGEILSLKQAANPKTRDVFVKPRLTSDGADYDPWLLDCKASCTGHVQFASSTSAPINGLSHQAATPFFKTYFYFMHECFG